MDWILGVVVCLLWCTTGQADYASRGYSAKRGGQLRTMDSEGVRIGDSVRRAEKARGQATQESI